MASTDRSVFGSCSFLRATSTSKPNLIRKSAPMIGRVTSAIVKTCGKDRFNPRSTFNNFSPNVAIYVPLAAVRRGCGSGRFFLNRFRGRTERSAPVSMRKLSLLQLSYIKRRLENVLLLSAAVVAEAFIFLEIFHSTHSNLC